MELPFFLEVGTWADTEERRLYVRISYPPASYIERIEIDDLFGEQKVRLSAESRSDPRVVVLFGNNGAGKTTVLNIVRSLLSAEEFGGHRTRLARTPFNRASVHFTGGGYVEARKIEGVYGGFDLSVRSSAESDGIVFKVRTKNGRVAAEDFDKSQRNRFLLVLKEIASIVPSVAYLDDRRTFTASGGNSSSGGVITRILPDGTKITTTSEKERMDGDSDPVQAGLEEFVHSVRREALLLSKRGDQDAQSIYTNLVKGIASLPANRGSSRADLSERLRQLEKRSESLSAYGLFSAVNHTEMLKALSQAQGPGEELVGAVIAPYVDSLSARLIALETLHKEMSLWINNLNDFIHPKSFEFRISDGFRIVSQSGHELPVSVLSSGERHLLHMMTRAFMLRSSGGLLIIDEPELSLNWTWQRKLISSLIGAFGSAGCQLLVASHSLEICSQYQNDLVEL